MKVYYDIIGDIHGCYNEFLILTKMLGYEWTNKIPIHPEGRQLVFVGDITDRGPDSLRMVDIIYRLVINHKVAQYVPGNHCNKLYRYFLGRNVQVKHGLETTVDEYMTLSSKEQDDIRNKFLQLYKQSPLYHLLDDGNLIVCHAGMKEEFIGRRDNEVKTFVLYGDISGKKHEDGSPVRGDWAKSYNGGAWIVYGHTPVLEPRFMNHSVNIDTGAVFGGMLTALRYPEMKTVSVPSSMPFVQEKFRQFD